MPASTDVLENLNTKESWTNSETWDKSGRQWIYHLAMGFSEGIFVEQSKAGIAAYSKFFLAYHAFSLISKYNINNIALQTYKQKWTTWGHRAVINEVADRSLVTVIDRYAWNTWTDSNGMDTKKIRTLPKGAGRSWCYQRFPVFFVQFFSMFSGLLQIADANVLLGLQMRSLSHFHFS